MHIEPGLIAPVKLSLAAATAVLVYLRVLPRWLRQPRLWVRTALAAVFFDVHAGFPHAGGAVRTAFHRRNAGVSELCYLPAMLGFGIGLFLQALIFEPQDMVHLAVNTLSLVIPLTWCTGASANRLRN
jgi:ABC-type Co2+ transport system permease subunit